MEGECEQNPRAGFWFLLILVLFPFYLNLNKMTRVSLWPTFRSHQQMSREWEPWSFELQKCSRSRQDRPAALLLWWYAQAWAPWYILPFFSISSSKFPVSGKGWRQRTQQSSFPHFPWLPFTQMAVYISQSSWLHQVLCFSMQRHIHIDKWGWADRCLL